MPSMPLQRTSYRDLTFSTTSPPLRTEEDPLNSGSTAALRDTGEVDRDLEAYQRPLEQIHASGLHEWGIAMGLEVSAKVGLASVNVKQGIAIDSLGRHISLAIGGEAELDPNAPTSPPTPSVHVSVKSQGVDVPVPTGTSGDFVLTIEFRETFDAADWTWTHMPLLRMQPISTFVPDGAQGIPLAIVSVSNNKVAGLSDAARRLDRLPTGAVRLRASQLKQPGGENPQVAIADPDAGMVKGLSETLDGARGVGITVPSRGAVVRVEAALPQTGGGVQRRGFAEASIRAKDVLFQRDDGKTTARVDTDLGNFVAGGNNVEGDVVVLDGNGELMIVLDGADAGVTAGGQNRSGFVKVLDSKRDERVRLEGDTGDVWFDHALRDLDNPGAGPITHSLLQNLFPLTNGSTITALHNHPPDLVGDATKALCAFIWSVGVHAQTWDINVTSPFVVAFIALARVTGTPARANIGLVDGATPSNSGDWGGGYYRGPVNSKITFQLFTDDDWAGARANCVVFIK